MDKRVYPEVQIILISYNAPLLYDPGIDTFPVEFFGMIALPLERGRPRGLLFKYTLSMVISLLYEFSMETVMHVLLIDMCSINSPKGCADEGSVAFPMVPITKLKRRSPIPKVMITSNKTESTGDTALCPSNTLIAYFQRFP